MSKLIEKRYAAEAVSAAFDNLHEVRTLREVVDVVRYGDDSEDEIASSQIDVLERIIEDKLHDLFHAIDFADDYFQQKPQKKKTKELAVLKKAA